MLSSAQSSAQSSARENFFQKKYTHTEVVIIQPLPHAIYTKFLPELSNLRRKTPSAPKIFAALL
jgi:hypothetical protein